MAIGESLIVNAISEIVKRSGTAILGKADRSSKVLKILRAVGLKPEKPNPDFDSVYAHALVAYGVDQPEDVLRFFNRKEIKRAFEVSLQRDDNTLLVSEAENFVEWNSIGDDLRALNIEPRLEFARFTLVFNEMVNLTRTPAETRREHKLDEILQLIKDGNLNDIRAQNVKMIQGTLSEQLKAWFKTLGYSFGDYDVYADNYYEWIIKIPARRGYDSVIVRCIERQAEIEDLEALKLSVSKSNTDEGWLVASNRKSKGAKEMAANDNTIFCFTFDELIEEHADFARYFRWLENFVKERGIDKDYVPLACRRDKYDQDTKEKVDEERYGKDDGWIEGYIDRWLGDPSMEHISILGEFGTGKTWFTHHYAYLQMQKYLEAKEKDLVRPRLPLVIQLRDYSKALNSESLFSDFFFRKHEIPLPGYSAFEQLNRMGKLLLIFDGFDEMADKLDRQKMINNFWELARIVVPGAKAILTCRTEHFPNAREGRDLLNAELKASTSNLTGDPPQFEILELEKFNEAQVRDALLKRTDKKTVDLIMGHTELLDLAGRPVMLEFILEALPDIEGGKPIDLSRIYLYAIQKKLESDFKSERTFTSMADKFYFMCELSWEMLITEKMCLNYRLFPNRLRNLFGQSVSDEKDLDHWHYDMMGNTLLIRNDDGDYTPAHRSLLEFFVAFKAVAELGMLPPDFIVPVSLLSYTDNDREPVSSDWNTYFLRERDSGGEIKQVAPLKKFEVGDVDTVLETLGNMGDAVLRFVHEITNDSKVRDGFHEFLAGIHDEFVDGIRDPEKQQNIMMFILRFRALSQEWEEMAAQGDDIHRFWKSRLGALYDNDGFKVESVLLDKEDEDKVPLKIEMVKVQAGSFLMGDEVDGPIHRVNVTMPFMIARVPVTQVLYSAVMKKAPSRFKGDELPVESVSWIDAVNFCNGLSGIMGLGLAYDIDGERVTWISESDGFRLPTEAEWEYACRAGTTNRFACGDLESDLNTIGWYTNNSELKTQAVGKLKASNWGIHDMHGNVWEWCWDWYKGGYDKEQVDDPKGPERGSNRVVRGGSWAAGAEDCRSAIRDDSVPDNRDNRVGFRLSRSVALDP